jgi:hypothetical protein
MSKITPAEWLGGDGWVEGSVHQMASLPNHVVYSIDGSKAGQKSGLKIHNDKGESVAELGTPSEFGNYGLGYSGLISQGISMTTVDGQKYMTFVQVGTTSTNQISAVLTSFDEAANQLSRVVIPVILTTAIGDDKGTLLFEDRVENGGDEIFDPVTGKLGPVPADKDGAEWTARVDGVDVYESADSTITDKWTLPDRGFDVMDKYLLFMEAGYQCKVYEVHTGEVVEGNNGGCKPSNNSDDIDHEVPFTGADALILEKYVSSTNDQDVAFLPSEKKSVILDGVYALTSVTPEGTFYATDDGKAFTIDPRKDSAPVPLAAKVVAPLMIADNGIAVISEEGNDSYSGRVSFVIPNK